MIQSQINFINSKMFSLGFFIYIYIRAVKVAALHNPEVVSDLKLPKGKKKIPKNSITIIAFCN